MNITTIDEELIKLRFEYHDFPMEVGNGLMLGVEPRKQIKKLLYDYLVAALEKNPSLGRIEEITGLRKEYWKVEDVKSMLAKELKGESK